MTPAPRSRKAIGKSKSTRSTSARQNTRGSSRKRQTQTSGLQPEIPPTSATVRTLGNGLELILQEDHAHPLVSVQIWVRAGSMHEEAWTGAGLAHCVEHMLFKGTGKRSAAEITQSIQTLGGQVNAYTTFNRTVYWIDGLSEHTEGYLEILADMLRNSRFDADELAREQDVIRREMAMDEDDPGAIAQHLLQDIAFRKHPLRQPIIGHRAVFDQISRAEVVGFVNRHYVPNNCFVVIAGDFDSLAVAEAVERHMGDWQRRPYEPVMLPVEPLLRGRRETFRSFNTELARTALAWPTPGESHEDKAALDVLAFLLGSGRSARLYQELREKRGIAHWVWAGAWGAMETGLFQVEVESDPADAGQARQGILEVIEAFKKSGPSAGDLAKAVLATVSHQLRSLATTRGQASTLGGGWLMAGSLDYTRHFLADVRALTPARIREVAQRYLHPGNYVAVTVGPEESAATSKTPAQATHGQPMQRFHLRNGLTLLVGENPRLPIVSIRAQFLAGVLAETAASSGASQLTAQWLLKGTRNRKAAEIASVLEAKGASLTCTADAHRLILGADVMRGDETLGLEVLSDLVLNATLPKDQLPEIKKRQLAAIREEKEDPLTVALRRARAELFAGTAFERTALGTEEAVSSLTPATSKELLNAHVAGANGIISIVGDIRAAEAHRLVEKTFRKLHKGKRLAAETEIPRPPGARAASGALDLRMDKEQAVLVIGFRTVGLHHPDSHVLHLIDEACSDMGSRLFNRIREELGLAYYVGAQSFSAFGAGAFYFYVGTEKSKLAQAESEMLAQIQDLARNGLSAEEIGRARTTWRSSWLRSQQGNASMADIAGWNELNGLGYDHFQRLPAIVEDITAADIKRAAARYFAKVKPLIVRIIPDREEG